MSRIYISSIYILPALVFLPHHSLVTSILLNCHNQISLTTKIPWPFPNFGPFPWLFTDLSRINWHFQASRISRKVVTLEGVMVIKTNKNAEFDFYCLFITATAKLIIQHKNQRTNLCHCFFDAFLLNWNIKSRHYVQRFSRLMTSKKCAVCHLSNCYVNFTRSTDFSKLLLIISILWVGVSKYILQYCIMWNVLATECLCISYYGDIQVFIVHSFIRK